MSRTYHHGYKWGHKVRERCKHLTGLSRDYWNPFGRIYEDYTWFFPMTEPSHWHNQFSTRPRRARERENYARLRKGWDPDDMVWPHDKKPHIYYW